MFPISVAMLKNPPLYDQSLESFSTPLMRLVEYDSDDLGQMTVPSDTGRWYRYIDMLDRLIDLFIQHAYRGVATSLPENENHISAF